MSDQPNNITIIPYTAAGTANTNNVNIRTAPYMTGNTPIAQVNSGAKISILGRATVAGSATAWYQIEYNGTVAYVVSQYITVDSVLPDATTNSPSAASNIPSPSANAMILPVPWFSQVDSLQMEACSPTSLLMVLKAYNAGPVTALVGATDTAMAHYVDITNITSPKTLVSVAQSAGPLNIAPQSIAANNVSDALRNYLSNRTPVIMLIDYCKLQEVPFHPARYLRTGATSVDHWWVVVGTDGDKFVINDPLWKSTDNGGRGGLNLLISSADLSGAFAGDALVPSGALS